MQEPQLGPKLPSEPKRLADTCAIWSEMNQLGMKYNCLSLGEGAPGYAPSEMLKTAMQEAIGENIHYNQYCRTFGHPLLVEQIAKRHGPKLGREIDANKEILVGGGANGVIGAFIAAMVNPGDEIVCFEPGFPMYFDHAAMNGGVLKTVPLVVKDGDWGFDLEVFRSALSDKTTFLILNSPHNPTGKCFTEAEMITITDILDNEFPNVVVLSDEVYDFLTFDDNKHIPFATLKNNWHRTVSVYSGGKLMNATGWKVGWAIGPERIIRLGGIINNTVSYCTNTPAQVAMSRILGTVETSQKEGEPSFVDASVASFLAVRDLLFKEIKDMALPWEPLHCNSGYFMMVDVSKCRDLIPKKYFETHDYVEGLATNKIYLPGTKQIPLDLAFVRWMG